MVDAGKIRTDVYERWRQRVREAEHSKMVNPLDYISLGANTAAAMTLYEEEIESDVAEAIEAATERAAWQR